MTDHNKWICDIMSSDACVYEDAYYGERPPISLVMPIIINMLPNITDGFTLGKLLELIGESQDISNLSVLDAFVNHKDENVIKWAMLSRQALINGELWKK